jgi:hypothetical protein
LNFLLLSLLPGSSHLEHLALATVLSQISSWIASVHGSRLHPTDSNLSVGYKTVRGLLGVSKLLLDIPQVVRSAALVLGTTARNVMRPELMPTERLSRHCQAGVSSLEVRALHKLYAVLRQLVATNVTRLLEHILLLGVRMPKRTIASLPVSILNVLINERVERRVDLLA